MPGNIKLGMLVLSHEPPSIPRSQANHGQMAPFGQRKLVCFYCNKRSNIKYDGHLTEWKCIKCDSVNHLDQNGDITDPPAANDPEPAPLQVQYATRSKSPDYVDSSGVFCTTCIKNQHLYTSSLREYEFDVEQHMSKNVVDYVQAEKEFATFKNGLEARYPQVCEDCEPRVLAKLKTAKRTAQTDHIGRLLRRTKQRRDTSQNSIISVRTFETVGKWSCLAGIFGQLLWHILTLLSIAEHHYGEQSVDASKESSIMAFSSMVLLTLCYVLRLGYDLLLAIPFVSPVISFLASVSLPKLSLIITLPSLLWSPKFREAIHGFSGHVSGYGAYYNLQSMLFALRVSFYLLMGTRAFVDPYAPLMAGAHLIMPCFVILIAFKMMQSVKMDLGPLFAVPEKIKFVGPSTGSRLETDSGFDQTRRLMSSGRAPELHIPGPIYDKLDSLSFDQRPAVSDRYSEHSNNSPVSSTAYNPQNELRQRFTGSSISQPGASDHSTLYNQQEQNSNLSLSRNLPHRGTPPFTLLSEKEQRNYSTGGKTPALSYGTPEPDSAEEMEWTPTVPTSSYRAFNSSFAAVRDASRLETFGNAFAGNQQPQSQELQFNQIPVAEQSGNFWYKVPPAPITPAQRLRNPPNQPRLNAPSPDTKQNFFNNVTRNAQPREGLQDTTSPQDHFAQQKFFMPETASSGGVDLADMLSGISVSKTVEEVQEASRNWGITYTLPAIPVLLVLGWMSWETTSTWLENRGEV